MLRSCAYGSRACACAGQSRHSIWNCNTVNSPAQPPRPDRATLPPEPATEDWRTVDASRFGALEGGQIIVRALFEIEGLLSHVAKEQALFATRTHRALDSVRSDIGHLQEDLGGVVRDVSGLARRLDDTARQASNADLAAEAARARVLTWDDEAVTEVRRRRNLDLQAKEAAQAAELKRLDIQLQADREEAVRRAAWKAGVQSVLVKVAFAAVSIGTAVLLYFLGR